MSYHHASLAFQSIVHEVNGAMSRLTAERMGPLAQDEILRYTPSRLVPDWFPMTHWTLQTLRLRTELGKGE
eukprot:4923235-Alexandrium_andersonii.AAC.1